MLQRVCARECVRVQELAGVRVLLRAHTRAQAHTCARRAYVHVHARVRMRVRVCMRAYDMCCW